MPQQDPAALRNMTTTEAYAFGLCDVETQRQYNERHQPAIREAISAWKTAGGDHAETSYYGAAAIRAFRAYWLGMLRAARVAH